MQVLWLSHFKAVLYLQKNELTGTLPTEMGNMNKLSKLLCTHCLNSLMGFAFCMIICISLLWIYDLNMESVNWPKYLTICKSCEFLISKGGLDLSNNELTGTLPTEMGNLNELCKLLCTHCLNSLMVLSFCMIICISLLWVYYLDMESVNWPKYLTTCKSCDFLISKGTCIWEITN